MDLTSSRLVKVPINRNVRIPQVRTCIALIVVICVAVLIISYDNLPNYNQIFIEVPQNTNSPKKTTQKHRKHSTIKKEINFVYDTSYHHLDEKKQTFSYWISGLGNTSLSNKGFDDEIALYCNFPHTNDQITPPQLFKYNNKFADHYKKIRNCESDIFSYLYSRTIVIKNLSFTKCEHMQSDSVFDYLYWRSPDFHKKLFFQPIDTKINGEDILLLLNKNTQITFIRCSPYNNHYGYIRNVHYSILPLKNTKPKQYLQQKQIHSSLRLDLDISMLPNILILIVDSTSRANFMRSTPIMQLFLEDLLYDAGSPSYLYQFMRHSTTGTGTWENLKSLFKGITDNIDMMTKTERLMSFEEINEKYIDLYEFFHKLGYIIPEYDRIGQYNYTNVWRQGFNEQMNTHFLHMQVHWRFCNFGRYPSGHWLDIIGKWLANSEIYRDGLPYFINLDLMDNHVTAGKEMIDIDHVLLRFFKSINLNNTLIWFLSDHGNKMGALKYGNKYPNILEVNNPFSFLLFPKQYTKYINNFDLIHQQLLQNQQKLITHWDLNYFYKQLPLLFIQNETMIDYINDIILNKSYFENIQKGLISVMFEDIPFNRSCKDIGFTARSSQYCLCAKKYILGNNSLYNTGVIYNNEYLVEKAIKYINIQTGDGNFDCKQLNESNFKIIGNVIVSKSLYATNEHFYQFNLKQIGIGSKLEYFVTVKNDYIHYIVTDTERVDFFKYEKCIYDFECDKCTSDEITFAKEFEAKYDWKHHVMFKNRTLMEHIMRNNTYHNLNLRLCSCKS
eukprot:542694_1